jgi:hypothetical protein
MQKLRKSLALCPKSERVAAIKNGLEIARLKKELALLTGTRARSSGTDLEQATMTSTKTPVSTLMDRQQRHDTAMREVEMYALKNPKAPPPKKDAEKK